MRALYVIWSGQFVSIFATRMTKFAITLWAWDLSGTATGLVLVGVVAYLPEVILSPFAGTLIDRWNRKLVLALSDLGAAVTTAVLLVLFLTDSAQLWHLYATAAISSAFGSFQNPTFNAVVSTMVPPDQYARANGMYTVIGSASGIAAPLLAGALLTVIDLPTIMVVDLITFGVALISLLIVDIPRPVTPEQDQAGERTFWAETMDGLHYIFSRRSLAALILYLTVVNIHAGFGYGLISPMILAKSMDDSVVLGSVLSAGSFGWLAGGLLMSIWGGPKKRIHAVAFSIVLWGLAGALIFGPAWAPPLWLVGGFLLSLFIPIINSTYIAILQAKVEPAMQGRIFGLENGITLFSFPISQLIASQLSDRFFEPALMPGGVLANSLGAVFGVGRGAGMGLVITIGGVMAVANGIAGYLIEPIREIESILPDHAGIREMPGHP